MYNRKQSVMKKWKRVLIAAALTVSMILALPVWSVGRAEAAPDLDKGCSLTINRPAGNAKKGNIKVDLYKVADAELLAGYDAYKLTLNSGYNTDKANALFDKAQNASNNVSVNDVSASDLYRDLAQEIANTVLISKKETISPTATLDFSKLANTLNNLEAGMYLVVAHGSNLSMTEYTSIRMNDDGKQQIVTMAYSDDNGYVYTYLPELIALPSRGNAPVGSFNTADAAVWSYGVTVTLKSEEEAQYTSLQIGKTFTVSEDAVIAGGDGCVFQIEATLNDEIVYSNVAAIPYEGRATGSVTLSKVIPVGAEVTVTEVYSGAAFTVSGEEVKSIVAEADREDGTIENNVFFTNNSNGIGTSGDIVTNSFTHGADGWTWNDPKPAQAQPETPEQ